MHTKIKLIFSFLMLVVLVSSCFKSEEYPIEPIISDPIFLISGDSAKLTFSFTDGDGDIGLPPGDTLAPYNPDSYYHYNLYVDYYEKDDENGWQRGRDLEGDSIVFQYRLKPIVVKGRARGIKGTMDVTMISFANPLSSQSDTIRFTIKLIDKALNESNVIETAEIYP
tara:strand:- start:11461 stop:11964 length:504 start_codon:yes stop_codon:yes gene_type:complete